MVVIGNLSVVLKTVEKYPLKDTLNQRKAKVKKNFMTCLKAEKRQNLKSNSPTI
jgi:hypothetical protein